MKGDKCAQGTDLHKCGKTFWGFLRFESSDGLSLPFVEDGANDTILRRAASSAAIPSPSTPSPRPSAVSASMDAPTVALYPPTIQRRAAAVALWRVDADSAGQTAAPGAERS